MIGFIILHAGKGNLLGKRNIFLQMQKIFEGRINENQKNADKNWARNTGF